MITLILVGLSSLVIGFAIRNIYLVREDVRESRRKAMRKPTAATVEAALRRQGALMNRMIGKDRSV